MISQKKTERRKKRLDSRQGLSGNLDYDKSPAMPASVNGKGSEDHYHEVNSSQRSPTYDNDEDITPKPANAVHSDHLISSPKHHSEQAAEKHKSFTQNSQAQTHKTSQISYAQQPQQQSFTVGA